MMLFFIIYKSHILGNYSIISLNSEQCQDLIYTETNIKYYKIIIMNHVILFYICIINISLKKKTAMFPVLRLESQSWFINEKDMYIIVTNQSDHTAEAVFNSSQFQ